ncbi:MAG: dihydrodipicolinate synthase family protein [Deltaproteobacteria bacterium]|nr:dihydrodipicolinate synthase family protein [Deltaproteobacteria bacterium]
MTNDMSLKGCFPPIPTPFDARGRVDHDHLALNLEKWQKTPLSGSVVLGSNGEAALLKSEEKLETWKTAGQAIGTGHLFIAGTGCDATGETAELTEAAARLGAHAAMIVTPHYYKARMDHTALVTHYTTIADRSPIPIILYNVPAFTGVDLSAETIIELGRHPNIIGLKESSGNVVKMGEVVSQCGDTFQVLAGSGSFLLPALSVGAVGGVMALAAVAPHALFRIVEDFERGDMNHAREVQLRLIQANAAVTSRFGIPGLKAALDRIHMYGGPVRPPLRPLDPDQEAVLDGIMREAGILEG